MSFRLPQGSSWDKSYKARCVARCTLSDADGGRADRVHESGLARSRELGDIGVGRCQHCGLGLADLVATLERGGGFVPSSFYAAVYFALPMIVVKGVFLALGGDSYWLTLTNDAPYFVNLALVYMAVGWLAVLLGFYLPLSGRISRRLPLPGLIAGERRMVLLPVLVAFSFGVIFSFILLREGAFGSALSEFTGNLFSGQYRAPAERLDGYGIFLACLWRGPVSRQEGVACWCNWRRCDFFRVDFFGRIACSAF